jgi:hypothetical protein
MSANNTTTQSTKMLKERTTKVRFADQEDEVNILQPFDPELKIQAQRSSDFKRALKEDTIYMYHLGGEKKARTKRSFQETPEVSTKRRRLNHLALTVV